MLGVLATLVIPRVIGVKSDAEDAADAANEKIIRNALERYYLDNDETYPSSLDALKEIIWMKYQTTIPTRKQPVVTN